LSKRNQPSPLKVINRFTVINR